MQEAKRGAERAKDMGSFGWMKPNISTNKNFLRNTLVSTLRNPYGSKKKDHHDSRYKQKYMHSKNQYHDDRRDDYQYRKCKNKNREGWSDSSFSEDDPKLKEDGAIDQRIAPPEGGYVYDAYDYSHQAAKDPQVKEKCETKVKEKNQQKTKDRSHYGHSRREGHSWKNDYDSSSDLSFSEEDDKLKEDGAIDQRLPPPKGGFVYDAYDYSHQGSKDPLQKEREKSRDRDSRRHSHSSKGYTSERSHKRKHYSVDDDKYEHKKKKKSKKSHKHKHSKKKHKKKRSS